jgi:hypothetical protein
MSARRVRAPLGTSIALAFALAGCAVPASDGRVSAGVPDQASFPEVAQLLVHHCGTLDCHGTRYRNLRVYGNEGLRWAATDRPLSPPCTTPDEIAQDYDSVVGLEPEAMAAVVADGGAHPERLSLVRKARGLEHHKGGTLIHAGDDSDLCLASWLAGETRSDVCLRALLATQCFPQP